MTAATFTFNYRNPHGNAVCAGIFALDREGDPIPECYSHNCATRPNRPVPLIDLYANWSDRAARVWAAICFGCAHALKDRMDADPDFNETIHQGLDRP